MDITHITSLLGGIALFLYGMSIMGAGLEKLAGGKMQGVLQKLTSSTIKGVIFGTLITGVIQSSAGTVVICVGLVNSGIMTLTQSVGVIMGANIGTTVTGQLIRMADISGDSLWLTLMQPKTFAPVVAFIGCIFYVFLRNATQQRGNVCDIHSDTPKYDLPVSSNNSTQPPGPLPFRGVRAPAAVFSELMRHARASTRKALQPCPHCFYYTINPPATTRFILQENHFFHTFCRDLVNRTFFVFKYFTWILH